MNARPETAVLAGYARLPQSLTGPHGSPVLWVKLATDADTGIILSAAAEGIPSRGGRLLAEVLYCRHQQAGLGGR